jgi:dTDP-glucose 4,6-dehydratase
MSGVVILAAGRERAGGWSPVVAGAALERSGKRVLLTGAAGFLGSHLADRLLNDGFDVIGVDNLVTGRLTNIAHLEGNARFRLLIADAIEPLYLPARLDWVVHFASPASPPRYLAHPLETLRVNSAGTYHLLDLARKNGAHFLLASSSEVYGDPEVHPQDELYGGNANPVGPRSVYTEAKRFAEALTASYGREHGVVTRIARIFNTYGPRMSPDDGRVVSTFIVQAVRGDPLTLHGDGSQTRSFQYVDDLVEGVRRLMDADHAGPVNLGNPEECAIRRVAELVLEIVGSPSTLETRPLPADDPRRRRPDITLARRLLHWEPAVPLRDGLARTAASLRASLDQAAALRR